MQYILRDPRGACQVDWIQDARPAPRSRSLEVNYSSNSDLANRFKVERWATFAQTWCELNLASRATNEWRYFNCSRLTAIILTVFLCKLYRIAGFYLNRTPLLFQLDRRRPSLLFPSILSLLVKMYRGGGGWRNDRRVSGPLSSLPWCEYLPLESGKNYFSTEIAYLFLFFFMLLDIIYAISWI